MNKNELLTKPRKNICEFMKTLIHPVIDRDREAFKRAWSIVKNFNPYKDKKEFDYIMDMVTKETRNKMTFAERVVERIILNIIDKYGLQKGGSIKEEKLIEEIEKSVMSKKFPMLIIEIEKEIKKEKV